jgi:hypothetical protein
VTPSLPTKEISVIRTTCHGGPVKKRLFHLMLVALLCVSCNKTDDLDQIDGLDDDPIVDPLNPDVGLVPTAPEQPAAEPSPPTSTLPSQALTFSTGGIKFINLTSAQATKYRRAMEIVRLVVGTQSFRRQVLDYTWNGNKAFVDNRGRTNAQIYQSILDGAETLTPSRNNTMDLEVEMYYSNNSTVGYTYANSRRIWVNTKFFNTYTDAQVANNLMHEWLHKLGYGHAQTWSTSRDHSVPYAIGRLVSTIGRNFQ